MSSTEQPTDTVERYSAGSSASEIQRSDLRLYQLRANDRPRYVRRLSPSMASFAMPYSLKLTFFFSSDPAPEPYVGHASSNELTALH